MTDKEIYSDGETITEDKARVKRPKMYRIVLLNDDYTTMDFVVMVLEVVFRKSPAQAVQIMMQVHKLGKGTCGMYTKEIAEAKVAQVHSLARENKHPLKCTMEEV